MKIGVVGAGPAGLTAAYLLKLSGHRPVVFEADDGVGGRTKTVHLRPGHHFDSGAGWIASTYRETLGLVGAVGARDELYPVDLRGERYVSDRGALQKAPKGIASALSFPMLPPKERIKLALWGTGLRLRRPFGSGTEDLRFDEVPAEKHIVKCVGKQAVPTIFEPITASACLALSQLSAAALRGLAKDYLFGRFFSLSKGMDSLWKNLASRLEVEVSKPVRRIVAKGSAGVEVVFDSGQSTRFDGCVVAAPITRVRDILDGVDVPPWIYGVRYAPYICVYAARVGTLRRAEVYPSDFAEEPVVVSRSGDGWLRGPLPKGHAAAVVSAVGRVAADLMDEPDEKVEQILWERGAAIDPHLFGIDCCYVVRVIRWPEAMPVFSPGHLRNLATWKQSLPVVFAGDWTCLPGLEGAVRSGIEAARQFGKA